MRFVNPGSFGCLYGRRTPTDFTTLEAIVSNHNTVRWQSSDEPVDRLLKVWLLVKSDGGIGVLIRLYVCTESRTETSRWRRPIAVVAC
jgi:hypothetical protein